MKLKMWMQAIAACVVMLGLMFAMALGCQAIIVDTGRQILRP